MNAPVPSFVLALLVLCGLALAAPAQQGEAPAEQTDEASAEQTAEQTDEQAAAPPVPQQAPQEASPPVPTATRIPDIDAHRMERLDYVRTQEEVVTLDLDGVDVEAEVVLTVDGEPLDRTDFRRRALMYAYMDEVDKHITRVLTLQQIERNVEAGDDPADYEVADEDLDRKIDEIRDMFAMQADMQGRDSEQAIADFEASVEASVGWDEYRRLVAADALFEKVFLPVPDEPTGEEQYDYAQGPPPADMPCPEWCPPVTWEALGTNEQGRNLRVFVHNYAVDAEPVPSLFKANVLSQVRIGLFESVGVDYFFDADLPDDVFVRVGDQAVEIDELWGTMSRPLSDTDVQLALREELTLRAMRGELEEADAWLDREEFEDVWTAHEAEFEGTLFPLRNIIMFRGYQSLDRYREHYRYRSAYEHWQKELVTDEDVLEHYQRGGRLFFEQGEVRVELAFSPLPTDDSGQPIFNEAGFAEAEQRLAEAMGRHGDDWAALQAEFPPLPTQSPGADSKAFQRSPFRMRVTESELSMFVTGYGFADDVFYHGVPGEMFGPWPQKCRRHAWGAESNAGAWAAKVIGYTRRKPLGAFEGKARDLAWSDFLDLKYFHWAQESLADLSTSVVQP